MKFLAWLTLCCVLAMACSAQDTTAPIIVVGASQSSVAIQVSDFKVEVNQQAVPGVSVTSLSVKHLQYVLINDERLHTNWPGGTDQQALVAKEFLKQAISPGSEMGTLVGYGNEVYLGPQNEKDPKKLSSEIRATAINPTRLYDAIVAGANWLAKQPTIGDDRKVVFLVCDGKDTGSHLTLADAIKAAQRASLPIFAFAPSNVEKRKEGQYLRELTNQSGGRAYFLPSNTKHLTFDDLRSDLADGFLLTLRLPSQKGFVSLNITEKEHPEISVLSPTRVFVP